MGSVGGWCQCEWRIWGKLIGAVGGEGLLRSYAHAHSAPVYKILFFSHPPSLFHPPSNLSLIRCNHHSHPTLFCPSLSYSTNLCLYPSHLKRLYDSPAGARAQQNSYRHIRRRVVKSIVGENRNNSRVCCFLIVKQGQRQPLCLSSYLNICQIKIT